MAVGEKFWRKEYYLSVFSTLFYLLVLFTQFRDIQKSNEPALITTLILFLLLFVLGYFLDFSRNPWVILLIRIAFILCLSIFTFGFIRFSDEHSGPPFFTLGYFYLYSPEYYYVLFSGLGLYFGNEFSRYINLTYLYNLDIGTEVPNSKENQPNNESDENAKSSREGSDMESDENIMRKTIFKVIKKDEIKVFINKIKDIGAILSVSIFISAVYCYISTFRTDIALFVLIMQNIICIAWSTKDNFIISVKLSEICKDIEDPDFKIIGNANRANRITRVNIVIMNLIDKMFFGALSFAYWFLVSGFFHQRNAFELHSMNLIGVGIWIIIMANSGLVKTLTADNEPRNYFIKILALFIYFFGGISLTIMQDSLGFSPIFRYGLGFLGAITTFQLINPKSTDSHSIKKLSFGQFKFIYLFVGMFLTIIMYLGMIFGEHNKSFVDPRLRNWMYFYPGMINSVRSILESIYIFAVIGGILIIILLIYQFLIKILYFKSKSTDKRNPQALIDRINNKLQSNFNIAESKLKAMLIILLIVGGIFPIAMISIGIADVNNKKTLLGVRDSCFAIRALSTLEKVDRFETLSPNGLNVDPIIKLKAAKNEYESFQLVFYPFNRSIFTQNPGGFYRQVRLMNSDFYNKEKNDTISSSIVQKFKIEYVLEGYPDKLVPWSEVALGSFENTGFWITLHVPSTAQSGTYVSNFSFQVEHYEPIDFTVEIKVLPFALPQRTFVNTMGQGSFDSNYQAMLLSYGIDPYDPYPMTHSFNESSLNFTFDWTAYDARVSENLAWGARSIRIGNLFPAGNRYEFLSAEYNQTFINFHRQIAQHFESKGWLQYAYVYIIDEPDYETVKKSVYPSFKLIKEAHPGLRTMITADPSRENIDVLEDVIDIWCPIYKPLDMDLVANQKAKGKEVWQYPCLYPRPPNFNFMLHNANSDTRLYYWHIQNVNFEGVLYWSVHFIYYSHHGLGYNGWGDGMLLYPEELTGTYTPSVRLQIVRDGVEDLSLMKLFKSLSESAGDGKYQIYWAKVQRLVGFDTNPDRINQDVILQLREEMVDSIAEYY